MKATRKYYQQMYEVRPAYIKAHAWPVEPVLHSEMHPDPRIMVLAEFLSVPDISKEAEIRKLIPQFFAVGGPRSFDQNLKYLKKLSVQDRSRHIDALLAAGDRILLRQGGGLRDPYNLDHFASEAGIQARVEFGLKQGPRIPFEGTREAAEACMSTLHALRREIAAIYAMRGPEPKWFGIFPKASARDELLLDRVSRYETALFKAIELKLTPAKILREAAARGPEVGNDTYEYFSSFTQRGSFLYEQFVRRAAK